MQLDIGAASGLASPMTGSAVLSAKQVAFLPEGDMYINIHTQLHPGGEIRGEVSCIVPPPVEWRTIALVMGDKQVDVQYTISGGTLDRLTGNPQARTITATITAVEDGELTIQLPRNVADSVDENGDDTSYMVWVDGTEEPDTVDDFAEDVRTLIISFGAQSEQIDVTGTFLVLESTED